MGKDFLERTHKKVLFIKEKDFINWTPSKLKISAHKKTPVFIRTISQGKKSKKKKRHHEDNEKVSHRLWVNIYYYIYVYISYIIYIICTYMNECMPKDKELVSRIYNKLLKINNKNNIIF